MFYNEHALLLQFKNNEQEIIIATLSLEYKQGTLLSPSLHHLISSSLWLYDMGL